MSPPSSFATYLDSTYPYQNWNTDSYSGSNVDLNFYSQKPSSQHFNTADPAFVGTATVNFTAYTAYLPSRRSDRPDHTNGNSGKRLRRLPSAHRPRTYQVVPEPATWALLALGLAALLPGLRRLRKPAVS